MSQACNYFSLNPGLTRKLNKIAQSGCQLIFFYIVKTFKSEKAWACRVKMVSLHV